MFQLERVRDLMIDLMIDPPMCCPLDLVVGAMEQTLTALDARASCFSR
jgi:hypothetical protein